MRRLTILLLAAIAALTSCKAISSILHDDDVVAEVGEHKLYRSDVEAMIPSGLSPEDSTAMVQQYINTWATAYLYSEMASSQLSKEEMDVTSELEAYRMSLLKYRYEQHYIADRLDTLVTEAQIKEYYDSHRDLFKLERPVLKVRILEVAKNAPKFDLMLRDLKSSNYKDIEDLDTLSRVYAKRFVDLSDRWMDAVELAKEFGTDYETMLSKLSQDMIRMEDGEIVRLAYVCDIQRSGTAPLSFCEANIKDMILSARKRSILESLERDLLNDALSRRKLVIHQK